MSKALDKLLQYLTTKKNVAEYIDEDRCKEIADDVVNGYEIDDKSRQNWLNVNKEAVKIVKYAEENEMDGDKSFPFAKSAKVVYPLIAPAGIQLASRLIQHVVRNDKVVECVVLGEDQPMIDPQTGQFTGQYVKESKAKRVSDYMSYECLIESDTWLLDQHKLLSILVYWGVAFKEVYYNPILKKVCSEIISPEDVIINHGTNNLENCRRITTRCYMTENEIIEQMNSKYFCEIDLELLKTTSKSQMDNKERENDSQEKQPIYEILKQHCWVDLDDDGYAEPYCVYVTRNSKQVLCIYPDFEVQDLNIDPVDNTIISVKQRLNIVDYHLINDPEGKFYSLGLNHLLLHQNKSITSILRQLIDAGTLKNISGVSGFITKGFKTNTRELRYKFGKFEPVEIPPDTRLSDNIMQLPFSEPSNVLLSLLEFLVQGGKETGFMSDILTGDTQAQNVPATTILALVEQSTRAFKPLVSKLFSSEKKEFKIRFHLNSLYLDKPKYIKFQGVAMQISKDDFDENNLDIVPVADPTMSSEAHKYARLQAGLQLAQTLPGSVNIPAFTQIYFTDLDYPNPENFVQPPQPPQPDPRALAVQLQAIEAGIPWPLPEQLPPGVLTTTNQQVQGLNIQIKQLKEQIRLLGEQRKYDLKNEELALKEKQAKFSQAETIVHAHKEMLDAANDQRKTDIEEYNAVTERQRAHAMATQQRRPNNQS